MQSEFESCIKKTDSCWIWIGSLREDGYPRFCFKNIDGQRKWLQSSRICYLLQNNKFDIVVNNLYYSFLGKKLFNICKNRACVNPNHFNLNRKIKSNSFTLTVKQQD